MRHAPAFGIIPAVESASRPPHSSGDTPQRPDAGGEGDTAAAEVQTEPRQDTDATTEAETHVLFWSVEFPASLNSHLPPVHQHQSVSVQYLPRTVSGVAVW